MTAAERQLLLLIADRAVLRGSDEQRSLAQGQIAKLIRMIEQEAPNQESVALKP